MALLVYVFGTINSEDKKLLIDNVVKTNLSAYSNIFLDENVAVIAENELFNTSNYTKSKNHIFELAKEYYGKYENTFLSNQDFDFWINLRNTSFLQLVNYYKVKNYIDFVKTKIEIHQIIMINLPAVLFDLLKLDYPIDLMQVTQQSKKSKVSIINPLYKFFKSYILSKFKGMSPRKEILLISVKIDFSTLISKNGLIKEDKHIYYVQDILKNNSFDRLLNQNFFSKQNFYKNDGNSLPNIFNYNIEEVLISGFFDIRNIIRTLKNYHFIKNNFTSRSNVLDILLKHNKNAFLIENFFMNAFKMFLTKRKYKTILLSNEMSAIDNAIVRIAKDLNIKTIGIQHGLINENDIAYEFSDFELSKCNPFPEYTVVWGNTEKEFFYKNKKFFEGRIKTFGNVVFDGLKYLPTVNKKEQMILMFATQPLPILQHRLQSLEDFVYAVNMLNNENIKVIVRLHPREVNEVNLYLPILAKFKNQDFELDLDKNLFLQLNTIDVLVTSFSTVAFDSMILKKQIVLLDYANQDLTGLIQKKVAQKAVDGKSLLKVLSQFINRDNLQVSEDYLNQLHLTYDNLDFNVAEKIKGLIEN